MHLYNTNVANASLSNTIIIVEIKHLIRFQAKSANYTSNLIYN